MKPFAKLLGVTAMALALTTGASASALASETCKDVKITVVNHAKNSTGNHRDIKVLEVEYLNGSTWKTEAVVNKILTANGGTYTWTEDLEKVEGESTKIRVVFKMDTGGATWSAEHTTATTTSQVCKDGAKFTKDITATF